MARTAWVAMAMAMGLLILCAAAMADEVEAEKPTDRSGAGKASEVKASEKTAGSSEFLDAAEGQDVGGYGGGPFPYFQPQAMDPEAAAAFFEPYQGGGYGRGYGRGGGYRGGYGGRRGGYGYGYGRGRGGYGRGW